MHAWIPTDALWWLGLYGGCGVLVPWLLRWTRQCRGGLDASPRALFQRGELGLFGLFLAISAVFDLRQAALPTEYIVANSVMLAISGLIAGYVWFEDYSRWEEGLASQDERTWIDSRKLLFLVFSIAFTSEVLLAHSAEMWSR